MKTIITASLLSLFMVSCNDYKSNPIQNDDGSGGRGGRGEQGQGGTGEGNAAGSGIFYDRDIKPLFLENCMPCHASGTPKDWEDYNTVTAYATDILGSIKHEGAYMNMPLGKPKLADTQIQLIEDWINTGMAEKAPTTVDNTPTNDDTTGETPTNDDTAGETPTNDDTPVPTPAPEPVDPGKVMYDKNCISCHSDVNVAPRLAGQPKQYLKTELGHFQKANPTVEAARKDPTMNFYAGFYFKTPEDIEFVAQYMSELDPCAEESAIVAIDLAADDATPDLAAGKVIFDSQCVNCHAKGNVFNAPMVEGQSAKYLLKSLLALKSGARPSVMMQGVLGGKTRKELIDVSSYLNSKPVCGEQR